MKGGSASSPDPRSSSAAIDRSRWSARLRVAGEMPASCADLVEECRDALMECAAEADDELLEKYLGGEPLTDDELSRGLVAAVKSGGAVPVLFGSAAANIGVQPLLDAVVGLAPSPAEGGADGPKFRADPYNRDPALLARYFGDGERQVAAIGN